MWEGGCMHVTVSLFVCKSVIAQQCVCESVYEKV